MALERAYFEVCLLLGRLLRSVRYSNTRILDRNGDRQVRKSRAFYAPFLIWISVPLVKLLDTGVRVLPQRDWEERERRMYESLYGASVRIDAAAHGMLILPCLAGRTLAALLEDPTIGEPIKKKAIEWAVFALADFHRRGFTHGDAMAENVMVDVDAGMARWFDFETAHEANRSMDWRRADDLRALLATCLVRTDSDILELILDVYADDGHVTRLLAASFTSIFRRSLAFHLAQAGVSFQCFRKVSRWLQHRLRH
jgi:tRNA A-37 threonylcarbamoyl transferase component Bud32